jgi:hypothetical protein
VQAVELALEQRYFREDVEKVLRLAKIALVYIVTFHRYVEEVLGNPQKRFAKQLQTIQFAIGTFEKLPFSVRRAAYGFTIWIVADVCVCVCVCVRMCV